MSTRITIDIISDVICPWCFIGKRRLERAIDSFRTLHKTEFSITWHPFFLSPVDMPTQSKVDRYIAKFGPSRIEQMIPMMQRVGREEGIEFDYGGPIGSTVVPHRVIDYVQQREPEQSDFVVETLFKSYFERRGNVFGVSDVMTLLKEEKVNVQMDALEAWLNDREGAEQMCNEVETREERVSGVPFFIIDGKYKLSGAQEPEAFLEIFQKIVA